MWRVMFWAARGRLAVSDSLSGSTGKEGRMGCPSRGLCEQQGAEYNLDLAS